MSDKEHYSVYVIELDKAVLLSAKFREKNPELASEPTCLYVGMTGKTPDERFEQHKRGYKACRYVKKYGLYLRRRMYEKFNPMTYEDAKTKEEELAKELRRQGYAVWQN